MIIHLFYNDKFSKPFVDFINQNYNKDNHLFIFFGGVSKKKIPVPKYHNVIALEQNFKSLIFLLKSLNNADRIIMHSMYNKLLVIIFSLCPSLLKKTIWIVWGGDLYYHLNRKNNLVINFYEYLRKKNINKLKGIATLVSGDFELAKKWYNTSSKHYEAIYMSDERTKHIHSIRFKTTKKETKNIKILVGNSASATNNHREVFQMLHKFRDKPIEVYCPLSYGDQVYAEEIKKLGEKLFPDKFYSLDKLIPMKEYMDFLNDMDIGIFNNNRQQGLGNIFSMLYLGKKVYLKKGTTMWEEINDEMKLNVVDIYSIDLESYNQFLYNGINNIENNISILDKRYEPDYAIKLWSEIFYK